MKSAALKKRVVFLFLASAFFLTASLSEAKTVKLACSATKTINKAIPKLKPGDVLVVAGTCNENVVIPANMDRITIDGQNLATINGVDPAEATLRIRGNDNTVKNLTITGGSTGIQVQRSTSALIDGVTVENVGGTGITVQGSSFARIVNSTIQNNPGNGINVTENSSARIGFLTNNDTVASPNTITGNNRGVSVSESSTAAIIGNTISNNLSDGILVNTVSHADIASNTIDANGEHGIHFGRNSGVDLGADSGSTIFDLPNDTTVGSENGLFGLRCFINSYADRRLGTLNGLSGAKDFGSGACIDSTI
jgi:nitrous oxidase accessory protein NosD